MGHKTISLLLIAVLMVSVLCLPVFSSSPVIEKSNIAFLAELGLINLSYEGKPDVLLSRAEAAQMFANFCKGVANANSFADVPPGHWAEGDVDSVTSAGIMTGYDANTFGADDEITSEQFLAALVRLLGYEFLAHERGGYPIGYMQIASSLGILPMSFGGVTAADAANLILKALDIEVMQTISAGTQSRYNTVSGDTLAYMYLGLVKIMGVVNSNTRTGIGGVLPMKNNYFYIDEKVVYSPDTSKTDSYLGYSVECYATDDNDDDLYQLVAMRINQRRNEAVFAYGEDIFNYQNFKYTFRSADGKYNEDYILSFGVSVVYNGREYMGYEDSDFTDITGDVTLIDNNGDGVYDIVIINNYLTDVVQSVTHEIVYLASNNHLVFDDYEYCYIMDGAGDELISFEINTDDIASIAVSKDNQSLTLLINSAKITGRIIEVVAAMEGGESQLVVDNKTYTVLSGTAAEKSLAYAKPGDVITLSTNHTGKVVTFVLNDRDVYFYAYLADVGRTGSGLNRTVEAMLYDSDGEVRITPFAKRINIDGDVYTNPDNIVEALGRAQALINRYRAEKTLENFSAIVGQGEVEGALEKLDQIIRYKLNINNEIIEVDTAAPLQTDSGRDNTLHFSPLSVGVSVSAPGVYTAIRYARTTRMFGNRLAFDSDALAFRVPNNVEDRAMFQTGGPDIHANGISYGAEGYYVDNDITAAVICSYFGKTTSVMGDSTPLTVVTKITSMLNNKGETVKKIYGMRNGSEIEAIAKNPEVFADVDVGDTIRFAVQDDEGAIHSIVYDYNGKEAFVTNSGNYYAYPHIVHGYVYEKKNGRIIVSPTPPSGTTSISTLMLYTAEAFNITVYDAETKIAYGGSIADIVDYKTGGSECSEVVLIQRDGVPISMVVYKK